MPWSPCNRRPRPCQGCCSALRKAERLALVCTFLTSTCYLVETSLLAAEGTLAAVHARYLSSSAASLYVSSTASRPVLARCDPVPASACAPLARRPPCADHNRSLVTASARACPAPLVSTLSPLLPLLQEPRCASCLTALASSARFSALRVLAAAAVTLFAFAGRLMRSAQGGYCNCRFLESGLQGRHSGGQGAPWASQSSHTTCAYHSVVLPSLYHRVGTLIRLRDAISTVRSLLLEPSLSLDVEARARSRSVFTMNDGQCVDV